ncbi:iron uptake transporter permease EfeU [Nocardioides sp. Root190]|uniref:iron uptake transporter permease EfeU n=1 Tax=Nocardioides sp. Root190 TaxID=1736488 RepID=UPI000A936A8A|nr:iron uptake transporter permease EfeU [Nocardioides sp. Root190]
MLANFLIGLREGLEAALVVSILVAYLVKSERRHLLRHVWTGVGLAVLLSVAVTLGLGFQSRQLDFRSQELMGGTLSLVAVVFVTWMVFWMAGAARSMAGELRGRIDAAAGRWWSLVLLSFLAVGREGLETGVLLWTFGRTATGRDQPDGFQTTVEPLLAALLGIAVAVVLGYLIYRGAVSINLTWFFTVTGVLLILVAGGVLSYGIHDLQEIDVLPGLNSTLYDVSHVIDPNAWYGALLGGMFNFTPAPTVLEAVAWVLYVVPVTTLYLRALHRRTHSTTPAPARAAASNEGSTS